MKKKYHRQQGRTIGGNSSLQTGDSSRCDIGGQLERCEHSTSTDGHILTDILGTVWCVKSLISPRLCRSSDRSINSNETTCSADSQNPGRLSGSSCCRSLAEVRRHAWGLFLATFSFKRKGFSSEGLHTVMCTM